MSTPIRIYQPGAHVPASTTAIATYAGCGYSIRTEPHLHWRPRLNSVDIARMGLTGFGVHYSSFSHVPIQFKLVSEEPLRLGEALDIQQSTNPLGRLGVTFLHEVADINDDGELIVYAWALSKNQEITSYRRGFFAATDIAIPQHCLQLSLAVRLICRLPTPVARTLLRMRYKYVSYCIYLAV